MEKKAVVVGGTGLIGSYLLDCLVESSDYDKVELWVRKQSNNTISHPKIDERIVNFDHLEQEPLEAHDVFCCIGTTLKKAGSKDAQWKVDHDIPVKLAELSALNRVLSFSVVSSMGANPNASGFYVKMKGTMEEEVKKKDIPMIVIYRPSILYGPRDEKRLGESVGKAVMKVADHLLLGRLKKYKGIHAKDVAKAMIGYVNDSMFKEKVSVLESDKIASIAKHG